MLSGKGSQGALNSMKANAAAGKIATSILSLMDKTKIQFDLYLFMVTFSRILVTLCDT